MLTSEQTRFHFGRIGLAFFLLLLVQQVVISVVSAVVAIAAPHWMETGWFPWALSYGPLYLVAFPVFLLVVRTVPDTAYAAPPRALVRVGAGKLLFIALCALGVTYRFNMETTLLSVALERLTGYALINPLGDIVAVSSPFATLFCAVLVAPVMEEIVFRGILYKKLAGFGGVAYMLVSAFLFAMFHINLYQFKYAFAVGLLLAAVAWVTGGIRYTIILHFIVNFVGSGVSTLLLAYASVEAVAVWGGALACVAAAGLALALWWLVKNRRLLRFGVGGLALSDKRAIFLNPGMVLLMALFLLLMLSTLLSPLTMRLNLG